MKKLISTPKEALASMFSISFALAMILLLITSTVQGASTVLNYSGDKVTYTPVTITFVTQDKDNITVYSGVGSGFNSTDIAGVSGLQERIGMTNRIAINKSGSHTEVIKFAYDFSDYGITVSPGSASNYRLLFRDHGTTGNWSTGGTVSVVGDSVIIIVSIPCDKDYDFALGSTNLTQSPLPVKLISFNGIVNATTVNLFWKTASEVNNNHFEIERSLDAKTFTQIGIINGSGNSNQIISYEFVDNHPIQNAFYRLKQVDFNGEFEYSNSIYPKKVNNLTTKPNLTVYPNPTDLSNPIKVSLNYDGEKTLQLFNPIGEKIFESNFTSNDTTIDISGYAQGLYNIVITGSAGTMFSHKVCVK